MKLYFLIYIYFFLFSSVAYAQSATEKLHFEATAGTGLKSKGITPLDFSFKANFDITSRLYVFASTETNLSYYKENAIKTYCKGQSLGGGLGVELLGEKSQPHALGARIKVLATIGHADLSRTSYDAGLVWYIKRNKTMFSPVVELGYRFMDFRTNGFENYGNAYLSFGIRY